jgi:hypothetical protein
MVRHGTRIEGRRLLSARRIRSTCVLGLTNEGRKCTMVRHRLSLSNQRYGGISRVMCGGVRKMAGAEVDERALPFPRSLTA